MSASRSRRPLVLAAAACAALLAAALPAGAKPHGSTRHPASRKNAAHHATAARPQAAGDSADGSVWKPDPKLLSQLGPERPFGPYFMRVPTGYTVEEKDLSNERGTITQFHIAGPKRPDGTQPEMTVITAVIASTAYVARSGDALLGMALELPGKEGVVRSDVEDGRIGDMEASRQYFKYPEGGRWIHGFAYVTTDGHTNAQVITGEEEPYSATFLPLAETVARTLRKPEP